MLKNNYNNNNMNNNYNGLSDDSDVKLLDEIIDCLFDDDDGLCGISEICSVICGKDYYDKWCEEDLEYVKEVMREFRGINVGFNLENECMYVESIVDDN